MRTIQQIHQPVYDPIGNLITYRVIPTPSISYLDPFLFLNHHGPQLYPPQNQGLPFGPHPHRGMETVTFILDGDIAHFDSGGHKSVIDAGGVQWMTAGKGLIHSEVSSDQFKQTGGPLEILQLWVNLPAKAKMCPPYYRGLQKDDIPTISSDDRLTTVKLISGEYRGQKGPFESGIGLQLQTIDLKQKARWDYTIPLDENIFCYLIRGKLKVNGQIVQQRSLLEFKNDSELIRIEALENSVLLLGHAQPLNEPVVSQGPFVMNTEQEIRQAYEDYQLGKFGRWTH
ncbi:hypothetical protein C8N47_10571 [Mangrovibacterium marinum]|uniref:Pirin family protein n=1 Tax=Mangrovibacterium marinum TaxID=1639118 RepID=A0A2T5C394_9BACT|nr:pirin family protein [Mangrovibacterium marinum]PTN09231.1 hypothetical protein C8N47_10571 [Mangrovibacterium marinum]